MMKKLTAFLLSALLLTLLCAPALAASDYDLVYDATELLDPDVLSDLGETALPRLRDKYGVEVRVDIVTDLQGYDIDEYADLFYDQFGYGFGDDHSGTLLMIYLIQEDDDVSFGDFVIIGDGSGAAILSAHSGELAETLREFLNEDALSGPLEEDDEAISQALVTYARIMDEWAAGAPVPVRTDTEELQSLDDTPAADLSGMNGVPCVVDLAGILSEEEVQSLDQTASEISAQYQCAVYTVVVNDFRDYGGTVRSAAEAIYVTNELGWGEGKDGVMLLLSMDDRDYSLIAYGYGNTAFTDYGKDVLSNDFVDNFRYDDWYGGLRDYIEDSGELLRQAREGNPLDGQVDPSLYSSGAYGDEFIYKGKSGPGPMAIFLFVIVIPLAVAGIVGMVNVGKMKSVRKAASATDYAVPGSMQLWNSQDVFTHTTERRVRIQTERSGGGGGGTSISHSGFSGKSGKF